MLGLRVEEELDFTNKPFGFKVRVVDTDGSFTDVILHLMISAANVQTALPPWAMATDYRMYCWRQTSPASVQPSDTPKQGFLLQFSLTTRTPVLTLYFVKGNTRKPISATRRALFRKGVVRFELNYTQLRCTMRQAYADELLYGFSCIDMPDTCSNPKAINAAIARQHDSLVETHIDGEHDSDDESPEQPGHSVEKAADDDAETAEDTDAAERLRAFLQGLNKNRATSQMLYSLAKNCVPYGWGCIRLELSFVSSST
jgi:hypothetical protein